MKSGWILQKQRPQFSGFGEGLNAATKFIYVFLRCRLPLVFRAFAANFHRMRELLPQLYRKAEIGWRLIDPTPGHRLGRRPVKGEVDFDGVEDLRIVFQLIEAFPLGFRDKRHQTSPVEADRDTNNLRYRLREADSWLPTG